MCELQCFIFDTWSYHPHFTRWLARLYNIPNPTAQIKYNTSYKRLKRSGISSSLFERITAELPDLPAGKFNTQCRLCLRGVAVFQIPWILLYQ